MHRWIILHRTIKLPAGKKPIAIPIFVGEIPIKSPLNPLKSPLTTTKSL